MVVAVTLLGAALGALVALAQPDRYESDAELLIRDPGLSERIVNGPAVIEGQPPISPDANIGLIELESVADEAAKQLDGFTPDEVRDNIGVASGEGPELVEITGSDEDPEVAAALANAVASAYVEFRREADRQIVQGTVEQVEAELASLDPAEGDSAEARALRRQLRELRTQVLLQTGDAEIAASARPSDAPASPGALRNAVVGGLAGFVAAVIAALLLARLRPRLHSRRALERAYGVPLIAELEHPERLAGPDAPAAPGDPDGERLRGVWARLRFSADGSSEGTRTMLASSAVPGAGVSETCIGLARIVAAEGHRAILVDADLRDPTLAARLGLPQSRGLSDYLAGREPDLEGLLQPVPGSGPGGEGELLRLLPAGETPPNPAGLLGGEAASELVERLAEDADLVLVDVPAIGEIADGLPLVGQVEGVLLIDRIGLTDESQARELAERLEVFDARTVGLITYPAGRRR